MTTDARTALHAEVTAAITAHMDNPKATSTHDRGRLVTEHYKTAFDDLDLPPETVLRDLLTDLHHYARSQQIDLWERFTAAGEVFREEVAIEYAPENPDAPRVIATVYRQQWDNDYAVTIGEPLNVDVTTIIEAMTPERRAGLEDRSSEADEIYLQAATLGLAERHQGPFDVEVVESLRNWEAVDCADCHAEGRKVAVDELDGEGGDIGDVDRLAEARVLDGTARCDQHDV